MDMVLI
jgi:hypothetical protein